MKGPNLWVLCIEGEESHPKGIEKISRRSHNRKFPRVRKRDANPNTEGVKYQAEKNPRRTL